MEIEMLPGSDSVLDGQTSQAIRHDIESYGSSCQIDVQKPIAPVISSL